jgi:hypothetical protein
MLERQDTVAVVVALTAALLAVVFAVVVAALLAAPAAGQVSGGAPSAACREWTDGCIVCARTPQGLACSTPGIACTRGPARCLRP